MSQEWYDSTGLSFLSGTATPDPYDPTCTALPFTRYVYEPPTKVLTDTVFVERGGVKGSKGKRKAQRKARKLNR